MTTSGFSRANCGIALALALFVPINAALGQSLNDLLKGSSPELSPPLEEVEPQVEVTLTPAGGQSLSTLAPGSKVVLSVHVTLPDGAHTYSQNSEFSGASKISLVELSGLEPVDESFSPDRAPVAFEDPYLGRVEKFTREVTWTRHYRYTGNVTSDLIYAAGELRYQVCDDRQCTNLKWPFEAFLDGESAEPPDVPQITEPQEPSTASSVAETDAPVDPNSTSPSSSAPTTVDVADDSRGAPREGGLGWYLFLAFLGGLFLNVMPCVLPVLAIKLLTLVQQAGENRGRLLLLNCCYAAGVIGVFLVLATLAATVRLGWGEQFQHQGFVLVMACVFFAMGLSLLGVYEIPIPGMIGSSGGHHQEGLLGAFSTGILATLLATPCSGPFMTSTLAWSVDPARPASVPFLIFGMMGLGMAFPYLVVALDPRLVNWLPKPGMWMVRFKEFAGLAVMGAVIWLLYGMDDEVVVPTLIILLGIGTGLWMIGRLYDHASPPARKWAVRALAAITMLVVGWWGYGRYEHGLQLAQQNRNTRRDLAIAKATSGQHSPGVSVTDGGHRGQDSHELPWQPFSGELLQVLLEQGRPVLIDFTADWCATCKANEAIALNTEATSRFVREHNVVTLVADYTRADSEIKSWLNQFGSTSVPLTVIYREGNADNPIILPGPYTEPTLLAHLREAVSTDVASRDDRSAGLPRSSN